VRREAGHGSGHALSAAPAGVNSSLNLASSTSMELLVVPRGEQERHRVVEVVRDAAGKPSHLLDALREAGSLLKPQRVRDVDVEPGGMLA
jgi:hypothetical protein